ncbi:MAG: preprotein translocase subunit YajC [Phycisphaerae bacterium]|nr:preprotein translocase subunit YajC [Phycisphaerae bacterium]
MRIWHVSVVLAIVVMLFVGQMVWAQATTQPAGDTAAKDEDAREPTGDSIKADEKSDKDGGDATTQKKPPGGGFGDMRFLAIMIGVMALLWWWMGRGRRKEQQKHREMLNTLKKGDKVTSIGGIMGTVIEVKDREVVVKVDESSNTRMKFLRSAIRNVGAPGKDSDEGAGKS